MFVKLQNDQFGLGGYVLHEAHSVRWRTKALGEVPNVKEAEPEIVERFPSEWCRDSNDMGECFTRVVVEAKRGNLWLHFDTQLPVWIMDDNGKTIDRIN